MRGRFGMPFAVGNVGRALLLCAVCLSAGVRPAFPAELRESPSPRPMRVGVMRARPPIAFVYPGDESGALRGLAVDLASMLNRALGRDSEFHEGNRDELLAWLRDGTIDYVCGLPQPLLPDDADAMINISVFIPHPFAAALPGRERFRRQHRPESAPPSTSLFSSRSVAGNPRPPARAVDAPGQNP